MVATATYSNIQPGAASAATGDNVKVKYTVSISGAATLGEDFYDFLVDADTGQALKGNYISGFGNFSRNEDMTFTMPNKDVNLKIECWTEVPASYTGISVEGIL